MSIPKVIHYCWFGNSELPELEKKCLKSWQEKLPDYKIVLWNENNSDLSECKYIQQAYENKKFAFVSDYIRIKVLYQYGGIYLDTDVEVLKSFDPLLETKGFLGFENKTTVGTAIIACEKGTDFAKQMIDYYNSHPFIDHLGNQNLTTNVMILNAILKQKGMEQINKNQFIDEINIYQRDLLYPKKISEAEFRITNETITIHRMKGSWLTDRQKRRGTNKFWINICRPFLRKCQSAIIVILGEQKTKSIELWIRNKLK